ncbi:MAG: hypothetical protein LAO03_01495 [Acidobacteriia bacterium]|nr:hypothetical protein [Terriglobia bacterium]
MRRLLHRVNFRWVAVAAAAIAFLTVPAACAAEPLDDLIALTSKQVSGFVEQFSDVKCIEQVRQEKLGKDDKVELKEDSTYDYLVILTNTGGELSLDESRLAVRQAKADKKNTSMLVSNGFATLFLVFHPYYAGSFQFTALGDEEVDGHRLSKVAFQHVRGTRSVAALALRGKEYPLELSGIAWIDPQSGAIAKITAGVENTMEDVGLKTLRSEVRYAPVPFRDTKDVYWFPAQATVEVETPRQHWRNTHSFTDYKKFSVSTEEQVANK